MKFIWLFFFWSLCFGSSAQFNVPDWSFNATIYEVNVRQFSQEGSFSAFQKELPRLKQMGVDIIWLMPIHPIGEKNRKGSLGSYYAVKDYTEINPEFGTKSDFQNLVQEIHRLDMKIIIDWVANHSSPDNTWVEVEHHKDWYTLDSTGNLQPTIGTDWWDVADLNYDNYEMRNRMIASMKYWVKEFDIDGFRCDVASWVPIDFWVDARNEIESVKQIFFLAEAEGEEMYKAFDMTYGWEFHHILNDIAKGNKTTKDIHNFFKKNNNSAYIQMHFTSNHDENSWNGTVHERLGDARFACAVIAATIDGMPLVYNGQETSLDKRLAFFEKDSIDWSKMDLVDFYTKLLTLKRSHPALQHGSDGGGLEFFTLPENPNVLIYCRTNGKRRLVALINLSDQASEIVISEPRLKGFYKSLFSSQKIKLRKKNNKIKLEAFAYKILYS